MAKHGPTRIIHREKIGRSCQWRDRMSNPCSRLWEDLQYGRAQPRPQACWNRYLWRTVPERATFCLWWEGWFSYDRECMMAVIHILRRVSKLGREACDCDHIDEATPARFRLTLVYRARSAAGTGNGIACRTVRHCQWLPRPGELQSKERGWWSGRSQISWSMTLLATKGAQSTWGLILCAGRRRHFDPTRGTLGNADPPEVYAFTPATVWQVRRPHIRRYTNSPAGRNLWNVSRRIQFALLASSAAKSSATNAYASLICQTAGFRCQA